MYRKSIKSQNGTRQNISETKKSANKFSFQSRFKRMPFF